MKDIRTLDLILSDNEEVQIEVQRRKFAFITTSEGTRSYAHGGAVLYIHVNGVTVCRIYGVAKNFTINDRRES